MTNNLILKHSFNHNGHRTSKMTVSKVDDMIRIWVTLGDKGNMIMLDKDNVDRLKNFLKNNS